MRKRLAERLTYSNVVATLALFLALGGGAWALSQNSVGTRQIKPNAVRSSDVKNETLRGVDVAQNSLTGTDIKERTLNGTVTGLMSISCGAGFNIGPPCVGNLEVNSASPKSIFTRCPEEDGKEIFTYGASVFGGLTGMYPEAVSNVAVRNITVQHVLTGDWVVAEAAEVSPTDENWSLGLKVWCIDGSPAFGPPVSRTAGK